MAGIDYTVNVKVDYEDAANDIIKQLEMVSIEFLNSQLQIYEYFVYKMKPIF